MQDVLQARELRLFYEELQLSKTNHDRDRRLIKRKVKGESLTEIAEAEGLTKNGVFLALKRLEPQLVTALKRANYGLDVAVMKMVAMTEAEKTEFFAKDGEIITERTVEDNGTRFKAREAMLKLHRGFGEAGGAAMSVTSSGPVMVIIGQTDERLARLKQIEVPSSEITPADAQGQKELSGD